MRTVVSFALVLALSASLAAFAAELNVPRQATAGNAITLSTTGNGQGTLYVFGPVARIKKSVRLGDEISLSPNELTASGDYTAVLRADGDTVTKTFYVAPGAPQYVNFLAQPSRVPVGAHEAISGTAFVMDGARNLVLTPAEIKFELQVEGAPPVVRTVTARDGVAWTRIDSSRRAGNAQFTASVGDLTVKRVVQQTAAEPCNLRIKASPAKNGILVETDPVRDCAGNPVPDGTIVTFTDTDPNGKSTVDARVKRGIAQALLPSAPHADISVASGVVVGNEIRWGGAR